MRNHHNTFKSPFILGVMAEKDILKIAIISGAGHALNYKRQHPHASDEEALRFVSKEMNSILEKLHKEE